MRAHKLATIDTEEGARAGVIVNDLAYDAARMTGDPRYSSMQAILDNWREAFATIERACSNPGIAGTPVGQVRLLAPLPLPGAVYCAGANYRDHAEEMERATGVPPDDFRAEGGRPWFFLRSPRTVSSPHAALDVCSYGSAIDWEAELVVVIGREARKVATRDALDFVAGYTCGNDLSARDQGFRTSLPIGSPFRADWTRHKNFENSCPLGPWIVPAEFLPDPANLSIRLWVNGALMQDSSTGRMLFSVAEQIASLSEDITLHPGDVIMTGTPAGVGAARREFLKPGDHVQVEIENIGRLENRVE